MLPLPVSVFITQIVALLGVTAATKLVILVAYYLKDLDIRLMYHENIFRHLEFYEDYNTSDTKKGLVAWMSLIAFLLSFIPTYLSFAADTKDTEHVIYTNIQTAESMNSLGSFVVDQIEEPLFTEFYNTANHAPANSTGVILENYIISKKKQTQINPSGVWYNAPSVHFSPAKQIASWGTDARYPMNFQTVNDTNIFSTRGRVKESYAISYNNKAHTQGSSTLETCAGNDSLDSNIVTNITSIDGHQVQGARSMNRTCYPITDPSLWLISFQDADDDAGVDSLLNSREDIYFRSASSSPQSSASYSMGVVARNWEKLNMNVAMVKKSAHITIFYSDFNRSLAPDSCISSNYLNKSAFNQDINMITCQLISLAKQNPTLPILQATRRSYIANKMINSVYTYIKKDDGHGILVDLTLYSAFFATRSPADIAGPEMLIAYQQVKKSDFDTKDFEQILQSINPFPDLDTEYGLNTMTDLVLIGIRLFGSTYNKKVFLKTTAYIVSSVRVSTVWIVLALSFAVIFLLIITASNFMTPKVYKTDLRSLLIHTLIMQENHIDSSENPPMRRRENTGLLTRAVRLEGGKSLKMDDNPIILSENIPMMDQTADTLA
ncbi:hypothetical protein MAM1_0015d01461 [Mucor ambiguus]|uniref:Uncharacterized protein n=1 Tax=Mucor ambiguus TaxID=91626 RepID=A0A0C9MFY0_9FUNG|nr:hypothetical protein MAM1_0015d01461 [Mucor ambiguus]